MPSSEHRFIYCEGPLEQVALPTRVTEITTRHAQIRQRGRNLRVVCAVRAFVNIEGPLKQVARPTRVTEITVRVAQIAQRTRHVSVIWSIHALLDLEGPLKQVTLTIQIPDDDGDDAPLLLLLLGEGLEVLLVSETSSTVIEPLHPELGGIFPPLAVFVFKTLHVLLPCFRNLH